MKMININKTKQSDLVFLRDLWNNGDVMKWVGFPNGLGITEEKMNSWYQHLVSSTTSVHFSIYHEENYCGETFFRIEEDVASLDIKLDPAYQGKGIGSYALTYCIMQVFMKYPDMKVKVDPNIGNNSAINLYTKLGFTTQDEMSSETNKVYTCDWRSFKPDVRFLKDNIHLRVFNSSDYETLWRLAYKEDHYNFEEWDAPYFDKEDPLSYEDFEAKFNKSYCEKQDRKAIVLNNEIIGCVSAYYLDKKIRWLDIGITIYKEQYWSKGIGTVALKQWINDVFSRHEIEHIGLTTWSGNERMMKASQKIGLNQEAYIPKVRYYNETYYASVKYGITREDWFSL